MRALDEQLRNWTEARMPFLQGAENRESFFRRVAGVFPTLDPRYEAIEHSYDDAKDAFREEIRDSGERYFEHLRAVALIQLEYLEIHDHTQISAGILHDSVEDKPEWTIGRVQKRHGKEVAYLVEYVTEPDIRIFGSKEEVERVYHARYEHAPRRVFTVKLPDRLHNLLTIGSRPIEKMIAKVEETERYYMRYAREHMILLPELREVMAIIKNALPT